MRNTRVRWRAGRCSGRINGTLAAVLGLVAFLTVVVALNSQAGQQRIAISGKVVDELGAPIAKFELKANGEAFTASGGAFKMELPQSRLYRLRFSASGYYPLTHTFSVDELHKSGRIANVTLVARKPGRVMFAFGGDLMTGRRYYKPLAGDQPLLSEGNELEQLKQLLTPIRPYLVDADIASVNLETVLANGKPETEIPKSITFYSRPPTLAALQWAGIDYVNLGNNHVYDFGDIGVNTTLATLQGSGIGYSGGGINQRQALAGYDAAIDDGPHGEQSYSMLGFVGWKGSFSPHQVAETNKGGAAWGGEDNIVHAVAREASRKNPVVVQYHGSREYSYGPSGESESRMKLAIDHGADLVVGHHPHVVHGFELYNGKLIAYSLGNFLFDQYFQETHRSALLYVWMDGEQFVRAEVAPLYVKHYQPTPAVGAVRQHILRRLKHQSYLSGVSLSDSGGHAVIVPKASADRAANTKRHTLMLERGRWSGKLSLDWRQELLSAESDDKDAVCQTGRDLLVTGDFESDHGLVNQPGTWRLSPGSSITTAENRSGHHSMALSATDGSRAEAVTRGFHRLVEAAPNAAHSVIGYSRSEKPQELEVCLEYAPRSRPFSKSLPSADRQCFGTIQTGEGRWQPFQVDFPPVNKDKIKGYRLRLQTNEGAKESIYLDDLSWVVWNEPVACDEIQGKVENIDVLGIKARQGSEVRIRLGEAGY